MQASALRAGVVLIFITFNAHSVRTGCNHGLVVPKHPVVLPPRGGIWIGPISCSIVPPFFTGITVAAQCAPSTTDVYGASQAQAVDVELDCIITIVVIQAREFVHGIKLSTFFCQFFQVLFAIFGMCCCTPRKWQIKLQNNSLYQPTTVGQKYSCKSSAASSEPQTSVKQIILFDMIQHSSPGITQYQANQPTVVGSQCF